MADVYPRTYFDALREAIQFVAEARGDESVTKDAVLDSLNARLCFLLQKLLAAPTSTGFSVFRAPDAAGAAE
jgi:hypothetical protein